MAPSEPQRQRLLSPLKLTFFGITLASVLQDSQLLGLPRDLDVAEIFSQAQSVVNGARDIGLQGQAHDKEDGDICSKAGFYAGLNLIMRLKEGGLLVLAPECKTFGVACRNQHKRTKENVEGDTSWSEVEAGSLTQDMERQIQLKVTLIPATCTPLWHQQLLSLPRQLHGPCKHILLLPSSAAWRGSNIGKPSWLYDLHLPQRTHWHQPELG